MDGSSHVKEAFQWTRQGSQSPTSSNRCICSETASAVKYLVAAIDVGTTYTGCAFSFCNKNRAILSPILGNFNDRLLSSKTVSCLLYEGDQFRYFGFDAQRKYADLVDEGNDEGWFLFRDFKMELYESDALRSLTIMDVSERKSIKIIDLMTETIKHMKKILMTECAKQATEIKEQDIIWVITVPTVWSQAAKELMVEAAERAGIDRKSRRIALESECATVWYRTEEDSRERRLVLLADLGGGTADITVTKIDADGIISLAQPSSGGSMGGNRVNKAFWKLLEEIFGEDVMTSFSKENYGEKCDLEIAFEVKKRTIKNEHGEMKMNIKIPGSLTDCFEEKKHKPFKDFFRDECMGRYGEDLKFNKRNILTICNKTCLMIFQETCQCITNLILAEVQGRTQIPVYERTNRHQDVVVLVGGFACSEILFNVFQEALSETLIDVVRPDTPDLAVLKGAVLFGHHPEIIAARVSKYTYGTDCMLPFEDGIDPEELAWIERGHKYCRKRFSVHVRVGEILEYDSFSEIRRYEVPSGSSSVLYGIFISKLRNPRYIIDLETNQTKRIGEIIVPLQESQERRFIDVRIKYGDTILKVEARDSVSGSIISATLDCLS